MFTKKGLAMSKKERCCSYLHISPASLTSWNILILLFPSCLLYSLLFIHSTVALTGISQNLNFCISISFLQNGGNSAPCIQAYLNSILKELHLQNREAESKPNIWFSPVLDLQMLKLILLSSA